MLIHVSLTASDVAAYAVPAAAVVAATRRGPPSRTKKYLIDM